MGKKEKHHFVQDAYIKQWNGVQNKVQVYFLELGKFNEKGAKEKCFWKHNYNLIDGERIAEDFTVTIDSKGINVIKNKLHKNISLSVYDRSVVATYVALQYLRTPRFRMESDSMYDAFYKNIFPLFLENSKKELTAEDIIKEAIGTPHEDQVRLLYSRMTSKEIKEELIEFIKEGNISASLNNSGHSKSLFKAPDIAEDLHFCDWEFLSAPKGTQFISSDNPCFTVTESKMLQGILSPLVVVYMPLSPGICLRIKPKHKNQKEVWLILGKKEVKEINKLILKNSWELIFTKNKQQLESIVDGFNHFNHQKSKTTIVTKKGDYLMFNLE